MTEKCLCGWKLKDGDEIIACPKCGTKYHQECWNRIYQCNKCGETTPSGLKYFQRQANSEEIKKQQQEKQNQEIERQRQEAEKQRQEEEARRLAEEQARQKAEQEKHQARINHLKAIGRDGYYEYKVISVVDKRGAVDTEKLMATLNDLGLDGWKLQCAYTNEMGKDALSIAGFGINATADQNVLIFERFVKFE